MDGLETTDELHFFYDAQSKPAFVEYNNIKYRYIHNLQGDIVAIVDAAGNPVVEYKYDAWGKSIGAVPEIGIGAFNPLRYRGYAWDTDSEQYYLLTRYYDPACNRFISADRYVEVGQQLNANNKFAYCCNGPIGRIDHDGCAFETIFDIISFGASIVDVVINPTDPWAWFGLIGDMADVLIPFVGGIGEATRALESVAKAIHITEDIVELTNLTENTLSAIKEASSLLERGEYTVYLSYTKEGLIEYVGITKDFDRRKNEWKSIRRIERFVTGLDKDSARCVEQTVISIFGRAKNGGLLSNKINSIGVKGSKYAKYTEFLMRLLKERVK